MLEKRPPEETITVFSGDEVLFKIDYDDYRTYNIFLSINGGEPVINAQLGGEAFTYSAQFEPGKHNVLTVVSESDINSDKVDITKSRSLKQGSVRFEWTVRVIPISTLYDSKFEKAREIIQNILMLYTIGTLGKKTIERVEKYYDSLSQPEKEDLHNQTNISEYIDKDG